MSYSKWEGERDSEATLSGMKSMVRNEGQDPQYDPRMVIKVEATINIENLLLASSHLHDGFVRFTIL